MGHATFNPELKQDKKKDGTRAIRIRITKDSRHAYYATGLFVKGEPKKKDARKGDWNPEGSFLKKNWVRSSHHDHAHYNATIQQAIVDLERIASKNPSFSAQQIKQEHVDTISGKKAQEEVAQKGFIAFGLEYIRRKRVNRQAGTGLVYETTLGYFRKFWGNRPDEAALLTPGTISQFVEWMSTCELTKTKKGYDASTINLAMRNYRTLFKNAVLEGWLPQMPNPFDLPPLPEEDKHLQRPTAAQLASLVHVPDLTPVQQHARNINLLQYHLNGARVSEMMLLRWSDVGEDRIDYRPRKRSRRTKSIKRHPGIDWILAQYSREGKYVFPYLTEADEELDGERWHALLAGKVVAINSALALVSKKAGLTLRLTTHMARRAFADAVLARTDNMKLVQEAVGWESASSAARYVEKMRLQLLDDLSESIYLDLGKLEGNNRETLSAEGCENEAKEDG